MCDHLTQKLDRIIYIMMVCLFAELKITLSSSNKMILSERPNPVTIIINNSMRLSFFQFVRRASTNTASGTISVSRVRRTAKRPIKECPSADATPDTLDRPKIQNRCRARVSIIMH